MLLQTLFPSLYGEVGAISASFYNGMNVKKSPVNEKCVIVSGKCPVELFMDYMIQKEYPTSYIDHFQIRVNPDNSISVIERD